MRLRNNPKAYEIMEENANLVILKPEEHKGHYHDIFEINQPLYIEIGMGKGDFIYQNALKHPENNYIGIEKFPSVLAAAINKINKNQSLPNLKLMHFDAIELENVFENGEIDHLFLNFSDPWPKKRHAKRRLTSSAFLDVYRRLLKKDGVIESPTPKSTARSATDTISLFKSPVSTIDFLVSSSFINLSASIVFTLYPL